MQFVILLLLVVALALLVLGLVSTSTPLVVASIVVSLVAVYAVVRARGMRDNRVAAKAAASTESERIAADKAATDQALAAARARAELATVPAAPAVEDRTVELPAVPDDAAGDNAAFGYVGADLAAQSLGVTPAVTETPAVTGTRTAGAHAAVEPVDSMEPDEPADPLADEPPAADTSAPLGAAADRNVWVVDGRPRYHLKSCAFLAFRSSEPVPLRQAAEDGFTPCMLCDPDTSLAV